jgi:RNA exonuclease 4
LAAGRPQRRRHPTRANYYNKKQRPAAAKTTKLSLDEQEQYVAMDCEMVGVGPGGYTSALARVTILNWQGNVIYDSYCQPTEPVTDYRTFVSGITANDLASDCARDFDTVRNQVLELVKNKIIIGHALKNDLAVLQITAQDHPWHRIRDTAKYEPFMKACDGNTYYYYNHYHLQDGEPPILMLQPRKLKDLSYEKLRRDIQQPGRPHCPKEDAKAALDLFKSVRVRFEKGIEYKLQKTRAIMERTTNNNQYSNYR